MSGGMPASGSGIMQRMPQQPAGSGPVDPNQGGGMTYRNGANEWSQFFGPTKGPIETAPYGSYRRENFALPDAYRGSNMYLTNVIITLVTEQDLWPVTVALPWRLTESEMEITWDQIIFDNTLLGQVGGCSQLPTPPRPYSQTTLHAGFRPLVSVSTAPGPPARDCRVCTAGGCETLCARPCATEPSVMTGGPTTTHTGAGGGRQPTGHAADQRATRPLHSVWPCFHAGARLHEDGAWPSVLQHEP